MQKSSITILAAWVNVQTLSKLCDQQSAPYPQLRYHHRFPPNMYAGVFPLRRSLYSLGRLKQITYSNTCLKPPFISSADRKSKYCYFFLVFSNTQEVNIAFMK